MPYMLLLHVPTGLKLFKGTITKDCATEVERTFNWFLKVGRKYELLMLDIEDEHNYYPMHIPASIARECTLTIKYTKEDIDDA